MNIIDKTGSLISAVAMAMTLVACSASPSAALPQLTELIAQTSQQIASDLDYEMSAAKQLPRASRNIRTASVEVNEMAEVVVVEASRLPAAEHFAEVTTVQSAAL